MAERVEGGTSFALILWNENTQKPATQGLKEGDKLCVEFEVLNAEHGIVAPVGPYIAAVRYSGLTVFRQEEKVEAEEVKIPKADDLLKEDK